LAVKQQATLEFVTANLAVCRAHTTCHLVFATTPTCKEKWCAVTFFSL